MRWLACVVLLADGVAHADEPPAANADDTIADTAFLEDELRVAHDAAAHGHCDIASSIGARVAQHDREFYERRFAVDPAIAACSAPITAAPVQAVTTRDDTPALAAGHLGGEVLGGALGGVGGGLALGALFFAVNYHDRSCSDDCRSMFAFVGGYAGLAVAAPVGVMVIGSRGDETGSWGATYAGSAIGAVVGLVAIGAGLAANVSEPLIIAGFAAPVVGAVVGFNLSRRYKVAPTVQPASDRAMVGVVGRFP